MNKKELTNNIHSYQYKKSTLDNLYNNINDDNLDDIAEIETLFAKNGSILATEICNQIKKSWIKNFPLTLDLEQKIDICGLDQKLIDWGSDFLDPPMFRQRFPDKEVRIGAKDRDRHKVFHASDLKKALKGLNRSHTVLLHSNIFKSFYVGVSGLRDLFSLIGDNLVKVWVDTDLQHLMFEVVGTREKYTIKPFAWDKLKGHRRLKRGDTPKQFLNGYCYNRVINLI